MRSLEPVCVSRSFDPEHLREGPHCVVASADAHALGGELADTAVPEDARRFGAEEEAGTGATVSARRG